jgi:hypothetical protein
MAREQSNELGPTRYIAAIPLGMSYRMMRT